ncbi:hypothetical protein [Clostridium perfringens]|uniref:hypothetical protein n=1 Tax=Clostridium perfringens TaxID=1502 RepID=UPI00240A0896|nr:hypothetical protein [Clostridium perfringens]WFB45990.1 hypothetical protein P6X90_06240 [Clostridium perfringens]WFD77559.1 hypothetical protein P6978_06240 [Clostridium perfringens]WFD86115.1 hypothetical protein P7C31_06300 [Clostridium perfringens]WFD98927.1 hypothetical protein P7D00_06295 [Clostridium perfringens]
MLGAKADGKYVEQIEGINLEEKDLKVGCPTGVQDMTNYKKHDPALLEIWDYEILPLDLDVIYNRDSFRVEDRELVLISTPETFKYKFMKISK